MFGNIFKLLRRLLSSIAIFVTLWAVMACLFTLIWLIVPICSKHFMTIARWGISVAVLIWFIYKRKLIIN